MIKHLTLSQKVKFFAMAIVWTGAFIWWVYQGHLRNQASWRAAVEDNSPEAYYP